MPARRSNGSPLAEWAGMALGGAKVDLGQARVADQFVDRALGGDTAKLHEENRVGQAFDNVNTVFDDANSFAGIAHERDEVENLIHPFRLDSRSGLVEQKHISIRPEQASKGNEFLLTE